MFLDPILNPKEPGTLYTLHSTLYTLHSTLYTLHSTLYTLHSTLYTLHSTTLYTLHSTLYTLHSTLYTLHSTLYTLHSNKIVNNTDLKFIFRLFNLDAGSMSGIALPSVKLFFGKIINHLYFLSTFY